MFAAMALAPVVSQLASQLLFGGQQGGKRRMRPLPGNSTMIGLPNHLPPNVYMSLRHGVPRQSGGRRRRPVVGKRRRRRKSKAIKYRR